MKELCGEHLPQGGVQPPIALSSSKHAGVARQQAGLDDGAPAQQRPSQDARAGTREHGMVRATIPGSRNGRQQRGSRLGQHARVVPARGGGVERLVSGVGAQ